MRGLRYIFLCVILLTAATTYVYSQSWDMFLDKGKELYEQGNYEKAIENLELYLKYETTNPKAEAKQLLEQAKKKLAEKAETPTNAEQVTQAEIAPPTEKTSPKVTEQPTQAEQPHEEYFIETALGLNMKMIYVEGGTFRMGNNKSTNLLDRPSHKVSVDSYYISTFEITQYQWYQIMGTTIHQQSSKAGRELILGEGDNYPMYYISHKESEDFCQKLSRITGKLYRLPTEAEWEFAATGGNKSKGYEFSGSNNIDTVAWYRDNSNSQTHPVGQKQANELGLHDMSGNVMEWCSDWIDLYQINDNHNPKGSPHGDYKSIRGGSWISEYWKGPAVYYRNCWEPMKRGYNLGFRVVCIPD